jgi:probable F420-dependent oxidoreductase
MSPYAPALITSGDFLSEYVATLEACGVESAWTVEHVIVAADYQPAYPYSDSGRMAGTATTVTMPDPLELLAFFAATTTTLRLGTAVVVAPLHSPTVLAKRAATLDRLSAGRVMLGLGIGWQREEYAAVGAAFSERGARLEECIGAMRALWGEQPASFGGRFVSFDRVYCRPTPAAGRIPIVLGGHSDAAVRRAARLADGWFPFTVGPDDFATCVALLRATAEDAGRDPAEVEITGWPGSAHPEQMWSAELAARYVAAGATRVMVRADITAPGDLPALAERLRRYRDEVSRDG